MRDDYFPYDQTHPATNDVLTMIHNLQEQRDYHRFGYMPYTSVHTEEVGAHPFSFPIFNEHPWTSSLRGHMPAYTRGIGHVNCEDVCRAEGVSNECDLEKCVLLKHNNECIAPERFAH